jgi:hypothetical protein
MKRIETRLALSVWWAVWLLAAPTVGAQSPAPPAIMMLQTSASQRQVYLANAVIWKPGGIPTAEQIREGPSGRSPLAGVDRDAQGEVTCTYDHGGAGAPGRTVKFTCRTAAGRSLRVKYFDGNPQTGNREVFGEVLATRLFWALGFDADAVYPVVIRCLDCPADPNAGTGPRAARRYLGIVEAFYEGTLVTSRGNPDQGWAFDELRRAIATLPGGEARARQQMEFDALSLLAVFVQHGDRKPSQQRLVCRLVLDRDAGEVLLADTDEGALHVPVLLERRDRHACSATTVTVQDLGATFGGAGQFTSNVRAKVHLSSWAGTAMFANRSVKDGRGGAAPRCRGNLAPSLSAGADADANPEIGDAGRRFLHERLAALTPDHVRALFEAAHIDQLKEPQQWRDRTSGQVRTGIDAWVGAFLHKVDQIGRTSCPA